MAYEICKRCGKMFEKNGRTYCETCFEKNEKEHDLIVEHIHKHPNATILDIITETGVSLKSINCLVEDGDFTYVENKLQLENSIGEEKNSYKPSGTKGRFHLRR